MVTIRSSVRERASVEPESIEAAEAEFGEVYATLRDIEAQLSARPRPTRAERVSDEEFLQWRTWHGAAVAALRVAQTRYSFLKQWLRRQRGDTDSTSLRSPGQPSTRDLIAAVVTVLDGLDIEEELEDPALSAFRSLRAWRATWPDAENEDVPLTSGDPGDEDPW